jgi:GDP-L-fucose synthase
MNLNQKIYVAGHRGMVGSAIVRQLRSQGFENLILRPHSELDLTNQQQVGNFFLQEKPDQVYLAAARVGGIFANNKFPGEFIYENLMIQSNVIHQAFLNGVKKLLFLGSSCIYPRLAPQPISEDFLLTGKLEPTNEPYALAKIAGIKMCESYNRQYGNSHQLDYRSVMPTNLYGPGDNYHPENSHVIPALLRRYHEAKINQCNEVVIWGTGSPRREFLYVDDLARACIFVMELPKASYDQVTDPMQSHLNVGFGSDMTILELANIIASIVGYSGKTVFDLTKLEGPPRKIIQTHRLNNLGWKPKVDILEGLKKAYIDFCILNHHQTN